MSPGFWSSLVRGWVALFSVKEVEKALPTLFPLGCWWCAQVLDEVERRRGISAALVYPFMRSLMESPFPAPGKTIKVKTFLPGAGNEVGNCYSVHFWP